MKRLLALLCACVLGLMSLSAQNREALEDSVIVGGISRPVVDMVMDFGQMSDKDKLIAHWSYAELMKNESRGLLSEFSDQELRDILACLRTEAYRYFSSDVFLKTYFENINKALQYELGEDLRFSYTLNDRTYGAGLNSLFKHSQIFIGSDVDEMLGENSKWISNAAKAGVPAVHIELMKTSARSVKANLFNIFRKSALDYLTKDDLKPVEDFLKTPLWNKYLDYVQKAKQLADMTSEAFVNEFKEKVDDVDVNTTQFKTSISDYAALSRAFPEYFPELIRPYAELTIGNSKYQGQIRDMRPYGKGKMTDKKGVIYEGDFRDGIQHGMVSITKPGKPTVTQYFIDGKYRKEVPVSKDKEDNMQAIFKESGKKYGFGTFYDTEAKANYQGVFIDDKLNGEGVVTEPRRRLEGEFVDGKFVDGVIYWTNDKSQQVTFKGRVAGSLCSGTREWLANDSSKVERHVGYFKNDILDGAGTIVSETKNEKLESSGVFAYGKMYGKGYQKRVIECNQEGIKESSVYEGLLYADHYHGDGRLTYSLKNIPADHGQFFRCNVPLPETLRESLEIVMEGRFDDGSFKEGRITCSDGSWYEGSFTPEGLKKGSMRRKYQDGSIYVGECLNGKRHGLGELRYADGTIYKGEFEYDEPVKPNIPEPEIPRDAIRHDELIYYFNNIASGYGKATLIRPADVIIMARTNAKSLKVVCKGLFKNETLLEGKVTVSDGKWLEGVFEDGVLMEGKGRIVDKYWVTYEGDIKNGYPHGEGECYYNDGTWFRGKFAWGNRMGGTHYTADGKVIRVYE